MYHRVPMHDSIGFPLNDREDEKDKGNEKENEVKKCMAFDYQERVKYMETYEYLRDYIREKICKLMRRIVDANGNEKKTLAEEWIVLTKIEMGLNNDIMRMTEDIKKLTILMSAHNVQDPMDREERTGSLMNKGCPSNYQQNDSMVVEQKEEEKGSPSDQGCPSKYHQQNCDKINEHKEQENAEDDVCDKGLTDSQRLLAMHLLGHPNCWSDYIKACEIIRWIGKFEYLPDCYLQNINKVDEICDKDLSERQKNLALWLLGNSTLCDNYKEACDIIGWIGHFK